MEDNNNTEATLKHYKALEFDKVLNNLSKFAVTSKGKTSCKNLEVFNLKTQIEYQLSLTTSAKRIIDNSQTTAPIEEMADVEAILKERILSADEIIELARNLKIARLTKNYISKEQEQNLIEITNNLYVDKAFEDEIFNIFDGGILYLFKGFSSQIISCHLFNLYPAL